MKNEKSDPNWSIDDELAKVRANPLKGDEPFADPLKSDETFYLPKKEPRSPSWSTPEQEARDIEYLRRNLFAALKIPKELQAKYNDVNAVGSTRGLLTEYRDLVMRMETERNDALAQRDAMKKVFEGCLETIKTLDAKNQELLKRPYRVIRVSPMPGTPEAGGRRFEIPLANAVTHLVVVRAPELPSEGDLKRLNAIAKTHLGKTVPVLTVADGVEVTVLELEPAKKDPPW